MRCGMIGMSEMIEMVEVSGGKFLMVSNRQTLVSDFSMGRIEASQELYEAVVGRIPFEFEDEMNPLENVSWFDAVRFCNVLSQGGGLLRVMTSRHGLAIFIVA